jgi:hypothetical protein
VESEGLGRGSAFVLKFLKNPKIRASAKEKFLESDTKNQ